MTVLYLGADVQQQVICKQNPKPLKNQVFKRESGELEIHTLSLLVQNVLLPSS